ncbi:MAG TPA: ATP-binding protein, partial [Acidimicrobiales bacterium]|nr:ATP-binding protein [Acidimicrobiales bacterium]
GAVPVFELAGTPEIRADKRRLERVVANLIANAAMHAGGATRIVVGPVPGGGADAGAGSPAGAFVAVDDAGPGVAPEQREAIFERFARGRAAGDRSRGGGVGLGLALVAEHVRLHGGLAGTTVVPDGPGARFIVALPVDPEVAALRPEDIDLAVLGRTALPAPGAGADGGSGNGPGGESRGLPRGLGEDPRGSRPPDGSPDELARPRASAVGPHAARGTTGAG